MIIRNGSVPSAPGPEAWFTGQVRIDSRFAAEAPSRLGGGVVTFEPGARTAWHTHPLGQTVIVTAGLGLMQIEGGPVQEIHPGDIVCFPAGQRHWHGASPLVGMTHIALAEALDGVSVTWLEKVSDEQYHG
ncbi:(R)-mandelonitrile lyase [Cypionkella sinensis]|uniref:Cupin domain-containing protein n=1 Tax=Cypionkella sinensis TaxID=1756043 RepID=A0ABV7J0H3_9RHOB